MSGDDLRVTTAHFGAERIASVSSRANHYDDADSTMSGIFRRLIQVGQR